MTFKADTLKLSNGSLITQREEQFMYSMCTISGNGLQRLFKNNPIHKIFLKNYSAKL